MQPISRTEPHLLGCFYEGISNPQRLGEGLRWIGERHDCDRVSLQLWDRRAQWGFRSDAFHSDGRWQISTSDHAAPEPALRAVVRKFKPGTWKILEQLHRKLPTADGLPHTFNYVAKGDAALCTRLLLPQAEALLSLHRADRGWQDAEAHTPSASEACRAMLPALELMARLRNLGQHTSRLSAVLNSIRMPIIVLDSARRPLASNAAASSAFVLSSNFSGGKVTAPPPGVTESQFAQLIKRACEAPAKGSVLPLQTGHRTAAGHLLVLPLMLRHDPAPQPAALLMLQGTSVDAGQARLLQQLYGMTPAEARLAQLVLDGQSPSDAASVLQISVATVRTQLSAVLKKTGAQRQSDLIRRLLPLLVLNYDYSAH